MPHLFWSAAEDGLILQHDLRASHTCAADSKNPKNVLIDLRSYLGMKAEAKCLAVNPIRPEMMAVGASDPFIRLYDRRMIKVKFLEGEDGSVSTECPEIPYGALQYFVPGEAHYLFVIGQRINRIFYLNPSFKISLQVIYQLKCLSISESIGPWPQLMWNLVKMAQSC